MADWIAIQRRLNALGANPSLTVDGVAGPMTIAAVKAFQTQHDLVPDGVVGPKTLFVLGLGSAPPVQETLPHFNPVLTPDEASKTLSQAYQKVAGFVPSKEVLSLMMAQTAHETANWTKMPNYNLAGIKATANDPYIQTFQTTEVINGVEQLMTLAFAAYKSALDGASAYVKLLMGRPHWWNGLQSGNPDSFIAGLTTAPAYFTGSATDYLNSVRSKSMQYIALAEKYAVPIAAGMGGVVAIVATVIAWWLFKPLRGG